MSNVVNTNTGSLAAQHALSLNERNLSRSMAQLSTGLRINSAADDAAGLAIGNKMTAQIRSLSVAIKNANDGISMLQTADAATSQMTEMLVRMRELAIQSANDTNSVSERTALQSEFSGLQAQLGNIITNTTWNGMKVLEAEAGTSGVTKFHVGASSNDSISLPLTSLNSSDVAAVMANTVKIDTQPNSTSSLNLVDKAMKQLDGERAGWGAMMNRLTYAADNASNVALHTSASRSRVMDTDYAQATAEMAKAMILDQAGAAMLSQANQQPMYVLALLR